MNLALRCLTISRRHAEYSRDLTEYKIIGKEQNDNIWAAYKQVDEEFEDLFVLAKYTNLKYRVVDNRRLPRLWTL